MIEGFSLQVRWITDL